jgi:hypothetical protein
MTNLRQQAEKGAVGEAVVLEEHAEAMPHNATDRKMTLRCSTK